MRNRDVPNAAIRGSLRYVKVSASTGPVLLQLPAGTYFVTCTAIDYSILHYRVVIQEDTAHAFDQTQNDHLTAGFTVSENESRVFVVEENQLIRVIGLGNSTYPYLVFFERLTPENC